MDYWNLLCFFVIIFNSVTYSSCWHQFPSLKELVQDNSISTENIVQSDYYYGECVSKDLEYYAHEYVNRTLVGKIAIMRGWLDIKRLPTCIKITSYAYEEDLFTSNKHQFQICVNRITYCHSQRTYEYFYYEWFLPPIYYFNGKNWDLYFLGLPIMENNSTWKIMKYKK